VLPWENPDEYGALVAALTEEHVPEGPTEEHLVEELAGTMWRKRRPPRRGAGAEPESELEARPEVSRRPRSTFRSDVS
jgi:hypothetical protein